MWKPGMKLSSKRLRIKRSLIKHTGIQHGSRISIGNAILYKDPSNKGIHGDENNVCS